MRKITAKAIALLITLAATLALAQEKSTLTDPRDKKTYKTVKIGKQVWMAENLNYEAKEGSMCYDNKPDNCKKYGRLYDWNTAMKACPTGWKLPSDKEWRILVDFAGGDEVAGKALKASNGWKDNGTDKFGFSALPGGYYGYNDEHSDTGFDRITEKGFWWSSSEYSEYGSDNAYFWSIIYDDVIHIFADKMIDQYSVRCIQN